MAEYVQIGFDDISEGDTIRVSRSNDSVDLVLQGVAEWQDDDGDWNAGTELLTWKDADEYGEEYFLVKSGSLPTEPGSLVAYDNHIGLPVFAVKTYGDEGWFTTFPDGSNGLLSDLRIALKEWTVLN